MLVLLKHHWRLLLVVVLGLALAGVVLFLNAFNRAPPAPSQDGRVRLMLDNAERDYVLGEMRHLLMAVQAIVDAAAAGDMARLALEARKVGMADVKNIPPAIRTRLIGKLPAEFRKLGFATHEAFDALALDADSLGDRDHALQQLAALMQRCVACHAAYTVLPPQNEPTR
jgi:hypothetical protein